MTVDENTELEQRMAGRRAQFLAYAAARQPPRAFEDALGRILITHAQAWGLSCAETMTLLEHIGRTLHLTEERE